MSEDKLWKTILDEGGAAVPHRAMTRRSFIELVGFSITASSLAGCRLPEQKIVPFVRQPVEMTPGVANWYASTCGGCPAGCGVLVKVRDGRPIKLEGNPDHPLSRGGLCAVAHAMVFGLYDSSRLQAPLAGSTETTWKEVDARVRQSLESIKAAGGGVRLLSGPISSPTSQAVISDFLGQFADARHIVYEPVSSSAIRQAHARSHHHDAMPAYALKKARLVVSFGADFLGSWVSPVSFTRDYASARSPHGRSRPGLRHVQFESRMSLTGSNADTRVPLSPAELPDAALLLAKLVSAGKGGQFECGDLQSFEPERLSPTGRSHIERTAREIRALPGETLVLCGSNEPDLQLVVNHINEAAGNYGKTLELPGGGSGDRTGRDAEMVELVREMSSGRIAALLVLGVNPAYAYFQAAEFRNALSRVPLKVSFGPAADETSRLMDFTCPTHHFLEAWDDAGPASGIVSLNQPVIAPLFKTRAYQQTLLEWSGDTRAYYDVLRARWKDQLFTKQSRYATFDEFWDDSLRRGVFEEERQETPAGHPFDSAEVGNAVRRLRSSPAGSGGGLTALLYSSVTMRDGTFANNPWLHEVPDPVTKVTWGNFASISNELAARMALEDGRMVRIRRGAAWLDLPAHIQAGQSDGCVAIALGYGRRAAGKAGTGIGADAYPLIGFDSEAFQYEAGDIVMERLDARTELARTQLHDLQEDRELARELTLADLLAGSNPGSNEQHGGALWQGHEYKEHKWGMAVDLNACTGCSACILSCQAENNIPVVGRDEVRRRREMHWIRVDRYYTGSAEDTRAVHQPLMCAQCDNASCEAVCPVLATVHSSEGLNMQVYNRCVGTRYCQNNCAYKVRRFNWFEYPHTDRLANLALNPDVTVRTRGVMEKCTFCVQRIQEAKIKARNEDRPVCDGEIQTACQQSCPAGAIVFGDLADPQSRVSQLSHDPRAYVLLDHLNLGPAVKYLARVRQSGEAWR